MPTLSAASAGRAVAVDGSVACRSSPGLSDMHEVNAAAIRSRGAALRIGHGPQSFVPDSAQRQPHSEMRAGLAVTQELDRAAVRLDALGNHGQPDARSADGASLLPPALKKGLEDSVGVFGMHTGTIVADVHDEIVALHPRADVDRAAARSELDGVRQQVLEHELELPFV